MPSLGTGKTTVDSKLTLPGKENLEGICTRDRGYSSVLGKRGKGKTLVRN